MRSIYPLTNVPRQTRVCHECSEKDFKSKKKTPDFVPHAFESDIQVKIMYRSDFLWWIDSADKNMYSSDDSVCI